VITSESQWWQWRPYGDNGNPMETISMWRSICPLMMTMIQRMTTMIHCWQSGSYGNPSPTKANSGNDNHMGTKVIHWWSNCDNDTKDDNDHPYLLIN
jgi:hypothetical protein